MKTIITALAFIFLTTSVQSQVTLSGALSGDYADLSLAFAAILSGGGSGTVHVGITADISTAQTAQLQSTNYRVIIRPVGNRTLTITAANKPLIHLNGTQHVLIDGIGLSGDSTLTLISTATNNTSAVLLLENDATQNRISNCTIRGGTITTTTSFYGVVALRNTSGNTGCDQDTISGNIIREAIPTALPFICISMEGRSGAIMNDDCVIADNHIVNFYNPTGFSDGVFSYHHNQATQIIGNHFYQTAPRQSSNATMAMNMRGIEIGDGASSTLSGSFVIRGNWIGGSAPYCGGNPMTLANSAGPMLFFGMFVSVGTAATQIDDNHIANLDLSFRDPVITNWYFFEGIFIAGGNVEIGVQQGNYIGSDTSTNSIVLHCFKSNTGYLVSAGINDQGPGYITIANNHIGGIAIDILNNNVHGGVYFSGINAYLGGGEIRDNVIGASGILNSIEVNSVEQDAGVQGISLESGAYTILDNTITGIRNGSGTFTNGITFAFGANAGNSLTCKRNTISELQVPDGAGSGVDVAGISIEASVALAIATVDIDQDTIRNLYIGEGPVTNAYLYGIVCRHYAGAANASYYCSGFIRNSLIEGLENRVSAEGTTCTGMNHWLGYKTGFTMSGNTVRNLRSNANELGGIICSPETPAMMTGSLQRVTITQNNIYDLANEGAGHVDVIGVEVSGRVPLVTFNRIYDLQSPNTTTTESLVQGFQAYDVLGTQTFRFQNNMVSLDHDTHGSARAAGIYSSTFGDNNLSISQTNAEFNSIYLGGNGDAPTSAFLKDGTGKVSLLNNIFYNDCTGSGTHTAIANSAATPATNWLTNASDHNYLVSRDPETLNLWGIDPQNITAWQTISNSDLNSYTRIADVSTFSDLLFVDKNTANLDLQLNHLDEVLVLQNAGIPVAGITGDYFGNPRDPNTPDLGAREFATIVGIDPEGILQASVSVSPNPTADFILVSIDADTPSGYALQLTDVQGKIVLQMEIAETTGFQKRISLQQLPEGIYALTVANAKGAVTRQVVKN